MNSIIVGGITTPFVNIANDIIKDSPTILMGLAIIGALIAGFFRAFSKAVWALIFGALFSAMIANRGAITTLIGGWIQAV